MKMISFILFGLIILSCTPTKKKNDLSEMNLKGKVKTIKETSFNATDKFGVITKGSRSEKSNSKYDTYTIFNNKGNIVEENIYRSVDYLCYKIIYNYDNYGLKKEKLTYYLDGKLREKEIYEYDSEGKIILEKTYNSEGKYTYRCDFKYENGNVIETKMFEFEYYANSFNYNGKYTSNYDEYNNLVEINSYDFNNKLMYKRFYKYDNKLNIIEESYNDVQESDIRTTTYQFEFDSKGNWIRRIDFSNTIPEYIVEREIEYN
jgi:hypothetical protein